MKWPNRFWAVLWICSLLLLWPACGWADKDSPMIGGLKKVEKNRYELPGDGQSWMDETKTRLKSQGWAIADQNKSNASGINRKLICLKGGLEATFDAQNVAGKGPVVEFHLRSRKK